MCRRFLWKTKSFVSLLLDCERRACQNVTFEVSGLTLCDNCRLQVWRMMEEKTGSLLDQGSNRLGAAVRQGPRGSVDLGTHCDPRAAGVTCSQERIDLLNACRDPEFHANGMRKTSITVEIKPVHAKSTKGWSKCRSTEHVDSIITCTPKLDNTCRYMSVPVRRGLERHEEELSSVSPSGSDTMEEGSAWHLFDHTHFFR